MTLGGMRMNFYITLGLDIVTVLIVGYCVYTAARKGFLRTVAQLMAYMAIVLVASAVSRAAAPIIYERFLEPVLLRQTPMKNAALASAGGGPADLMAIRSGSLLELLPNGVDLDYWLDKAKDGAEDIKDELLDELLESTVRPAAESAIYALCFTAVFCVLSVAANMILSAVGVVRYIPVIGRINSFLGAVVGAGEGVLLVWLCALFLRGMLTLGQGSWWFFTEAIARDTWIFRYFFDPGLLAGIL